MAYYLPQMTGFEHMNWVQLYSWAPLYIVMADGLTLILGNPALAAKILASLLHGAFGLSLYLWGGTMTGHRRTVLIAAMLTSFFFPILRVTWDLHRNVLGLILMFLTLWLLKRDSRLAVVAAALTALAHQMVAPLLGFLILFKVRKSRLALGSLVVTSAIWVSVILAASGLDLLEYFSEITLERPTYPLPTSFRALLLFLYLSVPILPFLMFARLRDQRFFDLYILLLICLALALLPSGMSTRYAILATIPLTLLISTWTLERRRKKAFAVLATVIVVFAAGYSVMPSSLPFPYFISPEIYNGSFRYAVPTSMLQNTIPLDQVPHARELIQAAIAYTDGGGKLITNRIFLSYAILEGVPIERILFTGTESSFDLEDIDEALQGAKAYTIWWVPGEGWHGIESLPPNFKLVESRGKLALYAYSADP